MPISFFLEQSYKSLLDFGIVFNSNQYWQIRFYFLRKRIKLDQLPGYQINGVYIIDEINYGMEIWIQFPKLGFPQEKSEVRSSKYKAYRYSNKDTK